MNSPVSILIVDDHPLFREGLKSLLARDKRFAVAAEAGSCREALKLAEKLRPDLAVVDISLPDGSGVDLLVQLRQKHPPLQMLTVSMHAKMDYVTEAFQNGALGYVLKESAGASLLHGLEAVAQGQTFLDASLSHRLLARISNPPEEKAQDLGAAYASLTPREQEVMRLLAEGFSYKEIAKRLYISPKTVENHRGRVMRKLGFQTSVDLVRYAARLGIIDIDQWKS